MTADAAPIRDPRLLSQPLSKDDPLMNLNYQYGLRLAALADLIKADRAFVTKLTAHTEYACVRFELCIESLQPEDFEPLVPAVAETIKP